VRLDAPTIAFMLDHGEAKVLITDREFSQALGSALSMCEARPLAIDVDDPGYTGPGVRLGWNATDDGEVRTIKRAVPPFIARRWVPTFGLLRPGWM
jgi:hypothetical protein